MAKNIISRKFLIAFLMPVIILGGIYGGIFTPTEAALVAVVYGLIAGDRIYREIKWKDLHYIFTSSIQITSVIMFIIVGASVFGSYLTREKIPAQVTEFMLAISDNWIITLLIINLS